MKEFSENLKHFREIRGLKKAEIANQLGISPSAYNFYENGRNEIGDREPSLKNLKKISQILNVSVDSLLGSQKNEFQYAEEFWGAAGYTVTKLDISEYQKERPEEIDYVKISYPLEVKNFSNGKINAKEENIKFISMDRIYFLDFSRNAGCIFKENQIINKKEIDDFFNKNLNSIINNNECDKWEYT